MNSGSDLPIRKPVSIWHRSIEVKFGALVKVLGKGVIAGAFGNWEGLAGSGVDTLDALGLKTNNVEAIATKITNFTARDLVPIDLLALQQKCFQMEKLRHNRLEQCRFRLRTETYLAELETKLIQLILPF